MNIKDRAIMLGITSASLYVTFQVVSNILSTKIAILPLLMLAVDGGTVVYPLTFTLRDFVHKVWGKKNARFVVILAGAVNIFVVLMFWLVGKMQPDSSWAAQDAYEKILMPVWRITTASIASQIISELIDTEIFSIVYKKLSDLSAVFISNSVSLVVDSFLFTFLAFAGVLPVGVLMQIIIANILVKLIVSFIVAPVIKWIPKTAEESEI